MEKPTEKWGVGGEMVELWLPSGMLHSWQTTVQVGNPRAAYGIRIAVVAMFMRIFVNDRGLCTQGGGALAEVGVVLSGRH